MNKFLTESGWKALAQKFKVKDNGLQQALAAYEKLAEDKYPERLKAVDQVRQIADKLKKSKECMSQPDVVKYLAEMIKAVDAEQKLVEAAAAKGKAASDAKAATTPPKPDPKMLDDVESIGRNDGMDEKPSRRQLFAKAPLFQKKYDEGYKLGAIIAAKIRAQPPGPSMSPFSKEQADRAEEYTRRKQARKEFIKYLNQWWSTVLPEDM